MSERADHEAPRSPETPETRSGAARETERVPRGRGTLTDRPEEDDAPRQGGGPQHAEGIVGTRPEGDPSPRPSRFDGDDLHEGDNTITGEGATIRRDET